ncbi:GspH/FimT family pseudopilin [Xanthomonas hortorum]|uniref:Type II secretion system protein H n=1 Tax=Xanthomonas hortorum pv. pelargonii TaxID=453602 RepID=A0AAW9ZSM1_9XANT|nr:GspH/FimT family pseudopilin [Xanthomonas hortorum]MCE4354180.1 GspH/FimT family pseudopilin [Xanthomonas hortorum pv. pelargonii]MCM5526356.1 GspH/FimT family pseudopilin [Xanthomonas hortorum pv. pelargonii]MCM5535407.1 GspH/FimT family pseudopilin [Xanthomonas hortorum pv. pelargonii]MCM5539580.1 GspH/FimT family pseudopilin [Xanthomonas hortorum pv. pelargonii]MCM5545826.1 GspH/FimT family pseudopilin [Xanthomonas hortorum pv. pelargonii]
MQAGTHSCAKGYTAVELLIVMAIVGIVAAVGLPSFRTLIEWQRAQTRVHLLTAHLAMARSLAVTHRLPVSICPSVDGASCRPDRDWSRGWILFKDPLRSGQPADAGSIVHVEQYAESDNISITGTIGRSLVRFLPNGRNSGTNITISVCTRAQRLADVIVNNSGRTRSVRYTQPISCPVR